MTANPPMDHVHAEPTKDFFVSMITRDITLEDCLLDLLDNCIDGARKHLIAAGKVQSLSGSALDPSLYSGFRADMNFDATRFELSDNCGGISLNDAVDYAFHFGRRQDAGPTEGGIGLYGIGLKRAVFKIGESIRITSTHAKDSFLVPIDVPKWLNRDGWDFDLEPASPRPSEGTDIVVVELHPGIAKNFGDKVFQQRLYNTIARDYAFILQRGFEVFINGKGVTPYPFKVVQSGAFEPVREHYASGDVQVEIVAGMVAPPPDDVGPSDKALKEVDYYGWFVSCNARIVYSGDKTTRTIWGQDGFPAWHFQYNGFMGIVHFRSDDPRLLPWTTTKREIDQDSTYKDTITKMKTATRPYLTYTNARKENLEEARKAEAAAIATAKPISELSERANPSFPILAKPATHLTNVQYKVPKALLDNVASSLGDKHMAATQVGKNTFDYYVTRELGEEAVE